MRQTSLRPPQHPAKDESGGEGSGLRSYVSSLLRGHRNPGSDAGGPSDAASLRRDVNEPLLPQLPEVELL